MRNRRLKNQTTNRRRQKEGGRGARREARKREELEAKSRKIQSQMKKRGGDEPNEIRTPREETNEQEPDIQRKDPKHSHDNLQPKKKQQEKKKKKMKEGEQRKEEKKTQKRKEEHSATQQ